MHAFFTVCGKTLHKKCVQFARNDCFHSKLCTCFSLINSLFHLTLSHLHTVHVVRDSLSSSVQESHLMEYTQAMRTVFVAQRAKFDLLK